jgi:soluble lytic murein transglycosylase
LRRAFEHWEYQADPMPFVLAEYNAGREPRPAVDPWKRTGRRAGKKFLQNIGFPTTRKYIDSIIARYEFYQRGRADVTNVGLQLRTGFCKFCSIA